MDTSNIRYDILVVEDNPGDYILVEDYFDETSLAKKIHWAQTFKKAIEILTDPNILIDVILLDLTLPDKSGEDLITEIHPLSKNKPIIILSGYQDAEFAIKSLALGASDYLFKDLLNATVLHKSVLYNIERNKILVNLKDSEERYADLFHFSPLPLWVFDKDSLSFIDVNDAAILHYGYSYEEFLSMDITEIMSTSSINDFKNLIQTSKETHKNSFLGVQNHSTKDGKSIEVELIANSFEYKGSLVEIISINDVTEKNRQIKAIEKQNEILKDIAWTQSHVVRAPLSRLMGLLNALKNNNLEADRKDIFYANIFKSAQELDEIIKSVVNKSQEVNIKNQK